MVLLVRCIGYFPVRYTLNDFPFQSNHVVSTHITVLKILQTLEIIMILLCRCLRIAQIMNDYVFDSVCLLSGSGIIIHRKQLFRHIRLWYFIVYLLCFTCFFRFTLCFLLHIHFFLCQIHSYRHPGCRNHYNQQQQPEQQSANFSFLHFSFSSFVFLFLRKFRFYIGQFFQEL